MHEAALGVVLAVGELQTTDYVDACDVVQPIVGNTATTRRWLPVQVVIQQDLFPCTGGATGTSTPTVSAQGTNFGGLQFTTGAVEFVNP